MENIHHSDHAFTTTRNELEAPISLLEVYRIMWYSILMLCIASPHAALSSGAKNSSFMGEAQASRIGTNQYSICPDKMVTTQSPYSSDTIDNGTGLHDICSKLAALASRQQQASSGGAQHEARDVAALFQVGFEVPPNVQVSAKLDQNKREKRISNRVPRDRERTAAKCCFEVPKAESKSGPFLHAQWRKCR
ncbi:hypothetical protein IQ06DRAFT_90525 [Phaeosphaeriaceae sp. SRC1lsM3a]|nr:hypothetical protein IQ06DRAFT_90525 [Stagonospora sp. SRC1lsM3a]